MFNIILKKFRKFIKFGNRSTVDIIEPYYMEFEQNIVFHGHAYVGPYAYWSAKGGIEIGNNVIIGPKSIIWTYNHDYRSSESIPYGGDDLLKPVVIEDHSWIGLGATILAGVTVGEGAVIGAGSVVTRDVPPCAIVGGNPAKVLGYRDKMMYDQLKEEKKFYLECKYASY